MGRTPKPKTLSAREKARRTVKSTLTLEEKHAAIARATSRVRTKVPIGNSFRG